MQKRGTKIVYSPLAIRDLDETWSYIYDVLQNPGSATETVNKVMDSIERLSDFPQMGPELASITSIESDYRFLVCGNYIAIYHTDGDSVFIDRIMYKKRDYIRVLLGQYEEQDAF